MSDEERKKLALFCNLSEDRVLSALDVDSIYQVPLTLHNQHLDREILSYFDVPQKKAIEIKKWKRFVEGLNNLKYTITIGIVGKYVSLQDAYKSIHEALVHSGVSMHINVQVQWVDADSLTEENYEKKLARLHGILVPGGFGARGVEGKMLASRYARRKKIPYFGICFGMQVALIDIARDLMGMENASSTELEETDTPIVALMSEWEGTAGFIEKRHESDDKGGTMRLGSYPSHLEEGTKAFNAYGSNLIQERHRHRYEVNIKYKPDFEKVGVIFSGMSPDHKLPEIIELKDHPWFLAVQFHPEFKSRPFSPHPLFDAFIKAVLKRK